MQNSHHQPLHAMTILLVDLIRHPTNPTSASATASRRAIDIIFALNGPDGGLVAGGSGTESGDSDMMKRPLTEGGRETWDLLRRLRSRAWASAGLDPAMVWTRSQAMRYCNREAEPEVRSRSPDPAMWSQAAAEQQVEDAATLEGGVGDHWNSPNIDWAYLDEVLRTGQQAEVTFEFGEFGAGDEEDPFAEPEV